MHDPTEVDGRDARPPRSSGLTLVGLLVGAVMITMVVGQLTDPGPPPHPPSSTVGGTASDLATAQEPPKPIGVESIRECPVHLGGLILGDHLRIPGSQKLIWPLGSSHAQIVGDTSGASFETLAFEAHAKPAGLVRGKPAIFSDVPSGDGALAWESGPGEVTYIGT
jgi:hypothetical protein